MGLIYLYPNYTTATLFRILSNSFFTIILPFHTIQPQILNLLKSTGYFT